MKKLLSLLLLLCLIFSLCGCGNAIVYEEEKTIDTWLKDRTEGYNEWRATSRMVLYQVEEGFKIRIETGSDMVPKLTVENDATNTIGVENTVLTVTSGENLYAAGTHEIRVFDPYRNRYTPAMKVFQKDKNTFRIFFWLYGSDTDFYPLPKLLTQQQYDKILSLVEAYNQEQAEQSDAQGDNPFNYTGEFMSLYKSKYFSDLAKNPEGNIYYEYTEIATENAAAYRNLIAQLELTEQDWRKSYEDLGYTGQKLNLQIVYYDLIVGSDNVSLTLRTDDAYTSPLLQSKGLSLTYAFCPSLKNFDYIQVDVK